MVKSKKINSNKFLNKKYLIIGLVMFVVILLGIYTYKWVNVAHKDKISKSYLIDKEHLVYELKTYEEISLLRTEAPSEYLVFVSFSNSDDTYELEKDMAKIIDKRNLSDHMYYVNMTKHYKKEDFVEKINKAFMFDKEIIKKAPVVLYFVDGELAIDGIAEREDGLMMQVGDFEQLLDIKGIDYE